MTEAEYQEYDGYVEWIGIEPPAHCFACSHGKSYNILLQRQKDGSDYCQGCGTVYWIGERKMAVSLEMQEGNFAIIRSESMSGHSPSRRFKTIKEATAAAVKLAEDNFRLEFEVVRIMRRVSCKPKATVTNVR